MAHRRPVTTASQVIAVVAAHYGVTPDLIRLGGRARQIAQARHVAMFLARHTTGASFPELGNTFRRHHTTVMLAVEKIETVAKRDPTIREHISMIVLALKALESTPVADTGEGRCVRCDLVVHTGPCTPANWRAEALAARKLLAQAVPHVRATWALAVAPDTKLAAAALLSDLAAHLDRKKPP